MGVSQMLVDMSVSTVGGVQCTEQRSFFSVSRDGGLWELFRKNMPPEAHLQRVETGGVGLGVPDFNYCCGGVEGWVELKATETRSVGLRPEQVAWISRRVRAGGRVFIAVRRVHDGGPRKGDPVDELWIHAGSDVLRLHRDGLSEEGALYVGRCGPRRWDRGRVVEILLG